MYISKHGTLKKVAQTTDQLKPFKYLCHLHQCMGVQEFDRHLPWDAHGQRVLLLETQGFAEWWDAFELFERCDIVFAVARSPWYFNNMTKWCQTSWQWLCSFSGKDKQETNKISATALQYYNTNMAGWKSGWILRQKNIVQYYIGMGKKTRYHRWIRCFGEFRPPQVMTAMAEWPNVCVTSSKVGGILLLTQSPR